QVFNLSDGAYFDNTTPLRLETVEFTNKDDQEYGVVESEYGITFIGYYKKSDSNDVYDIDVYIDGSRIETLKADKKLKKVKDTFDVDGNGFEFILEDKYLQESHLLEFKESKSNKLLMDGSVKTISMQDKKFSELRFMDSLGHVDAEKIKDMYYPNAIGFLATEENLEDVEFMGYIKGLMVRFPEVEFKGFCFDENVKREFLGLDNIKFITIRNVKDIFQKVEIFISNHMLTGKYLEVFLKLVYTSEAIYTTAFDIKRKFVNIDTYDNTNHVIIENYKLFGYSKEEVEIMNFNIVKVSIYSIFKELGQEQFIDFSTLNLFDFFHFQVIDFILKNKSLKKIFYEKHKLVKKLS
ncbi:MAG: hypothetical protein M0Q02_03955, partial [Candidatus Muirbacterium halophilum]|nr:hypothetical protein [Candidatus Muirbacterium halophilum]